MKPEYEKIIGEPEHSFITKIVNRSKRSKLSEAWHYHPEIEICYTVKSNGKRFVGNQISDYSQFDLVMLGSNLPHGFVTDHVSSQIVIQINEEFMGKDFLHKPELREIKNLFTYARRGIEFGQQTKNRVADIVELILKSERMDQLVLVLSLLNILSQSKDAKPICSEEYALDINVSQFTRLKLVYDHIMLNFRKEVSIKEVAQKLNLSEAGFYKFIKKQTKKSYTQIINEVRINNACKELIDSEKTISEIAYNCGFNNQSYFNRKFKYLMGTTPHAFRAKFSENKESYKSQLGKPNI